MYIFYIIRFTLITLLKRLNEVLQYAYFNEYEDRIIITIIIIVGYTTFMQLSIEICN